MLNTNFVIYFLVKLKLKIKFFYIVFTNKIILDFFKKHKIISNKHLLKFNSKNIYIKTLNQYKFNIFLFVFLFMSLYHFFFVSIANQSILCLMYLTVGATIYLFFSGFIYFIKLYAYNRFTGFIQDFWRVSLTVFWLIEGSLLLVVLTALALGPILPQHIYRNELKLGCEYIQYVSFEAFIIKHLPLLFLVLCTSKEDDEKTSLEQIIIVFFASLLITWVLLDEFYLLFHITNIYMRETPSYSWGSKKWVLSHSTLWRTKMWSSYFGICTFTKFLHILFSAYFILFWITSFLKEGGVASEADNLEEASDENVKAAANFNLVAIYIWLGYMLLYPIFNRTVYVFIYNNTGLSNYYTIIYRLIKEVVLLLF